MILSLSIRTVFCIIATTSSNSLLLLKIFFKSTFGPFISLSNAPTMARTTWILQPRRCSLALNTSCPYFFNFSVLFAPMLFCCEHAMSQMQIFLSVSISKIKSGLLAVVVSCRWNSKSHTSFALLFSSTVPYPIVLVLDDFLTNLTNSCCFAQATARISSVWLCLVRYSLFASPVYPAASYSPISECWVHILQLPLSIDPLAFFHDLVSTIWSSVVIIAAVFPELRF